MGPSDLPRRCGRRPPLVSDDGVGERAFAVEEATGYHLWRGGMAGPEPRACYRGETVKPRLLAFERDYGPVPEGYRLDHWPHAIRCIRPDH